MIHADGHVLHVLGHVSLMHGEGEQPLYFLIQLVDLSDRAVQSQPAAVKVDERHADRRIVERAAEELLGRAQGILHTARLGDVLAGPVHPGRLTPGVAHDLAA